MNFGTFVFVDTETTGLSKNLNQNRLTTISVTAVSADDVKAGNFPTVQNRITLFFNTDEKIEKQASEYSGITNEAIKSQPKPDRSAIEMVEKFLNRLQQPLCLVAYCGTRFHFPILQFQLEECFGEGARSSVYYIDAYDFLKPKVASPPPPRSLERVYTEVTGEHKPTNLVKSEQDTYMMLKSILRFGGEFVEWANNNHSSWNDFHATE